MMGFNMTDFKAFRKFQIRLPHAVCKAKNNSIITLFGEAIMSYLKSYSIIAGIIVFVMFLFIKHYFRRKKSKKA